jgi:restriction system protein
MVPLCSRNAHGKAVRPTGAVGLVKKRGVESLTDKGTTTNLTAFNALEVFKTVQSTRSNLKRDNSQPESPTDEPGSRDAEIKDHRTALLDLIKSLSPGGFERLSQRLLRESGFQHVTGTGKTNDGGVDGIGILQVNPFVTFTVLFQCKRYQGVVNPSQVRDFRGAMAGRADKGLIITTGTFTLEAKKETRRDGVPPIELVDGDILRRYVRKT